MYAEENINAPKVGESPLNGVGYKPLTGGASIFQPMKMIQDLGVCLLPNENVRRHYAIYECPYCGKIFTSRTDRVKEHPLMSCGCERYKHVSEKSFRHGLLHHPLNTVWKVMKDRCSNPNGKRYKHYGGKGVVVCEEWKNNFKAFYDWSMSNGYEKGLQINRIDNDGDYCPENCEFTNRFINGQNTSLLRSTNTSGYRGVSLIKNAKKKKWFAQIVSYKKYYYLGHYQTAREAAQAYNDFIVKHKTKHTLNKI